MRMCKALGFGTTVALPATTLRVVYATVWDEAAPRGVSALSRRAALWAERRWLVSCAGYESCAEDSAEPVPRAWPTTLTAGGGGLALVHLGLFDLVPHRAAPHCARAAADGAPEAAPYV